MGITESHALAAVLHATGIETTTLEAAILAIAGLAILAATYLRIAPRAVATLNTAEITTTALVAAIAAAALSPLPPLFPSASTELKRPKGAPGSCLQQMNVSLLTAHAYIHTLQIACHLAAINQYC